MNARPTNDKNDFFDENGDETIKALEEMIAAYEAHPAIICPTKLQQMELCYAILKKLVADYGDEVEVEYKPHEPFQSMGYISFKSDSLEFSDTKLLSKAIAMADNVEMSPLLNNRIELALSFDGLTKPLK